MFNMIDKSTFDPPRDTTSPLPGVLDGSFWDFARNEWPRGHGNSEVEEAGSRPTRAVLRCDSNFWLRTSGFSTSTDFARNEWPWAHSNSEVEEAGSRAARALLRCDSNFWLQTSGFSTSTSFCRCWRCKRLRQPSDPTGCRTTVTCWRSTWVRAA